MDLLNDGNLEFMDYSFLFDETVKTSNNNNNNAKQPQRSQINLYAAQHNPNNNNNINRTLSSTYYHVDLPIINDRQSSLYNAASNYDDDFNDDEYLNLESYRRSRNRQEYSSLPSTNSIENERRFTENNNSNNNDLEKVKTKITSIWNNVRYGWTTYSKKIRTNFDKINPICILGRYYSNDDNHVYYLKNIVKPLNSLQASNNNDNEYCYVDEHGKQQQMFEKFEDDISTRLWFTYRKNFPLINGTNYSSDAGWGCMLRSVQMLIGQGFLLHFFGRSWSLYAENLVSSEKLHREIISWFNDRFSNKCPFGLHRLLLIATSKIGKKVGDWFGPSSAILILRDALQDAREHLPMLNNINIYVAQDCTIYKQDVLEMCLKKENEDTRASTLFTPVIILISLRLGGEELNEIYVPTLKLFLEMENCLGIIGGKPKHSLYILGYQGKLKLKI